LVIHWHVLTAQFRWSTGNWQAALDAVQEADRLAADSGVSLLRRIIRAEEAYVALNQADLERAQRCIGELVATLPPAQPNAAAMTDFFRSGLAMMRGDRPAALDYADAASRHAQACGMPIGLAVCELQRSQVLAEMFEWQQAQRHLEHVIDIARRVNSPLLEHAGLLLLAHVLRHAGDAVAARESLSRGFAIGRQQGFAAIYPWSQPEMLPRLVSWALDAGIEVDHALHLIKRHARPV
jgi:ATP/maltotriose-dependent transcriptional regulator MalT